MVGWVTVAVGGTIRRKKRGGGGGVLGKEPGLEARGSVTTVCMTAIVTSPLHKSPLTSNVCRGQLLQPFSQPCQVMPGRRLGATTATICLWFCCSSFGRGCWVGATLVLCGWWR